MPEKPTQRPDEVTEEITLPPPEKTSASVEWEYKLKKGDEVAIPEKYRGKNDKPTDTWVIKAIDGNFVIVANIRLQEEVARELATRKETDPDAEPSPLHPDWTTIPLDELKAANSNR